jgi:hypothetical protein
MWRRYHCLIPECEADEYVQVCFAGVEYKDTELGVLVDVRGSPTNRWEDGTAGVPAEVKDWILMDDCAPVCPVHGEETEWRD